MDKLRKKKLGKLRNMVCPFCDSGIKFKKCKCYHDIQGVFTLSRKIDAEMAKLDKEGK